MSTFYYKLLSDKAFPPKRVTPNSAGLNLYSPISVEIPPRGKILLDLQLQILLPENTYGRIAPKLNLGHFFFIDVGGGVIDYDYQGSVKVILYNFGDEAYKVGEGQAVAQLICEKIVIPDLQEFIGEIEPTERGQKGFGSSNKTQVK